jgi:pyruvate/2-oxoacid:ferredoxin oxidoreductase alpha subunit/Pyruvate/2-oxoacid:ferredoxin oxidoreductase gamma subunit
MNILKNKDNLNNFKNLGLKNIVVRFAGDSGDGMQLTGERLAKLSAIMGNDVLTLADYPAEIRAPAGSLGGVSGYQMTIGSTDVYTTGDKVDILIAMNPAALKVNIKLMKKGGIIITNSATFTKRNCLKAGYLENPLENNSLNSYRLISIDISKLVRESLKSVSLSTREKERCKNFFSLGIICWLLNRKVESTVDWIKKKFFKKQSVAEGNQKALIAGLEYCESNEIFSTSFIVDQVDSVDMGKGVYAYINGSTATAWGLICAAQNAKKKLFLGSYPITPATNILQELSLYKQLDVITYQAEDEIAGVGTSIGAAFAGALAATSTSGPGIALKSEFINLANGSESWQIPKVEDLPSMITKYSVNITPENFQPYKRFTKTLARPWITPGTKNMEHCIGGLEKQDNGEVSSDGKNHHKMCNLRLQKVKNVALEIPFPDFYGKNSADILLLSWGSSFGAVRQATYNLIKKKYSVSHCHLKYLNPFFQHLDKILSAFKTILVIENNLGQLIVKIRSEFSVCTESFCEVRGRPIIVSDIEKKVKYLLKGK